MTTPTAVSCVMRHRLTAEYAAAVTRCDELFSARMIARVNAEHDDFDASLTTAIAWRDNAKFLLTLHQDEHG
jgi:hypothetical protein